jgi:hypothetical protein
MGKKPNVALSPVEGKKIQFKRNFKDVLEDKKHWSNNDP